MSENIIKKAGKKIIPDFLKPLAKDFYRGFYNFLKYGQPDFFSSVDFENITACNRRCSYCPNSIYGRGLAENKKLMDEKTFKKIINELAEIKYSGMIRPVFYGEPLLDSRFPDWIRYIREKLPKADIIIFTNGDILTLDLYKKLTKAGANLFIVSNHNGNAISENLEKLLANFKKLPYKSGYPHQDSFIHESAYVFEGNIPTIFYRNPSRLESLFNRGGLMKNIAISKTKLNCGLPSSDLTIDWEGNAILCCNDYFSSVKFGNVNNESFLKIWNKNNFRKLRKDLKRGVLNLEICKKCKLGK
jgi:2-deoxy-scyllo-inosamine dehydrogenase (SAM-dependent)